MSLEIKIFQNDIVKLTVHGAVNDTNNSLLGGLGVDGAIYRSAGPRCLEEKHSRAAKLDKLNLQRATICLLNM